MRRSLYDRWFWLVLNESLRNRIGRRERRSILAEIRSGGDGSATTSARERLGSPRELARSYTDGRARRLHPFYAIVGAAVAVFVSVSIQHHVWYLPRIAAAVIGFVIASGVFPAAWDAWRVSDRAARTPVRRAVMTLLAAGSVLAIAWSVIAIAGWNTQTLSVDNLALSPTSVGVTAFVEGGGVVINGMSSLRAGTSSTLADTSLEVVAARTPRPSVDEHGWKKLGHGDGAAVTSVVLRDAHGKPFFVAFARRIPASVIAARAHQYDDQEMMNPGTGEIETVQAPKPEPSVVDTFPEVKANDTCAPNTVRAVAGAPCVSIPLTGAVIVDSRSSTPTVLPDGTLDDPSVAASSSASAPPSIIGAGAFGGVDAADGLLLLYPSRVGIAHRLDVFSSDPKTMIWKLSSTTSVLGQSLRGPLNSPGWKRIVDVDGDGYDDLLLSSLLQPDTGQLIWYSKAAGKARTIRLDTAARNAMKGRYITNVFDARAGHILIATYAKSPRIWGILSGVNLVDLKLRRADDGTVIAAAVSRYRNLEYVASVTDARLVDFNGDGALEVAAVQDIGPGSQDNDSVAMPNRVLHVYGARRNRVMRSCQLRIAQTSLYDLGEVAKLDASPRESIATNGPGATVWLSASVGACPDHVSDTGRVIGSGFADMRPQYEVVQPVAVAVADPVAPKP